MLRFQKVDVFCLMGLGFFVLLGLLKPQRIFYGPSGGWKEGTFLRKVELRQLIFHDFYRFWPWDKSYFRVFILYFEPFLYFLQVSSMFKTILEIIWHLEAWRELELKRLTRCQTLHMVYTHPTEAFSPTFYEVSRNNIFSQVYSIYNPRQVFILY